MQKNSQGEKITKPPKQSIIFQNLIETLKLTFKLQSSLLIALLTLSIFYTMYFASMIFIPIVFAIIFKLLLSPVVKALNKFYIPYKIGAAIVLLIVVLPVIYALYGLSAPALVWLDKAPQIFPQIEKKLSKIIAPIKQPLNELNKVSEQVTKITQTDTSKTTTTVYIKQPYLFSSLFTSTWGFFLQLGISLTLLYFLLASGDDLLNEIIKIIPTLSKKKEIVIIAREAEHKVATYLLTITIINFIIGFLIFLIMVIFHMPNPVLWGAMAAIFEFIPYLGVLVGTFIIAVVAIFTFDNVSLMLIVPLIYYLTITLISALIVPYILGYHLSLNPIFVFLAVIIGALIWGIPGILISVPMAVIVKIILENLSMSSQVNKISNES